MSNPVGTLLKIATLPPACRVNYGALLLAGALTACGPSQQSGPNNTAGEVRSRASGAPTSGNASALEVAAAARGNVECPARNDAPPRSGAPVDDVLGVRPGMSYTAAQHMVLCSHPLLVVTDETSRGFDLDTYSQKVRQGFSARFAEPRVQKTSRQIMQQMQDEAMARGMNARRQDLQPGQSKWFVGSMGLPGQEKVISAAREEWFAQGRNPTMASIEQALIAKYGPPTQKQNQPGYTRLRWAHDPHGQLIGEASPLYQPCQGSSDPDAAVSLSAECGVLVQAQLYGLRDNPDLAQRMQVGTVDSAAGLAALSATQQGLQGMEAQRRASQLNDAAKNAQAPQL